jgi:hypothetical protein
LAKSKSSEFPHYAVFSFFFINSFPLRPNILLRTHFSNTRILHISPKVNVQVSEAYRAAGEVQFSLNEIWGSHSGENDDDDFLGFDSVQTRV